MECKYLYQVLPFLNEIDKKKRERFEEYFYSAPVWLMDSFQIVELDAGVVFVKENTPVDTIYIIGRGMIKATDYRIYGITYDCMRFEGVYAMGGMEVIMDLDRYCTTLETVTPCTIVKIAKEKYARWLNSDIRALKLEAKIMGHYLFEQGKNSRAFLFLQGADRLAFYLVETYTKYAKNGILYVDSTRQELSESSGLCVKTINRAVKKFEENGWITRKGSKFYIDSEQYRKMNAVVSELIER